MSAPISVLPRAEVRTEVRIPLRFADGFETTARVSTFRHLVDEAEHLLLSFDGTSPSDDAPLVRLHSECLTGDVFGSERCDCGPQLREAVERLSVEGGALLTCGRKAAESGCTRSSTPTRCKTPGSTPTRRTPRWVAVRTNATTPRRPRCSMPSGSVASGC